METPKYPREQLSAALALAAPQWLEHPDVIEVIGGLLDLIFFSSLATEEGESVRFQVVLSGTRKLEDVRDSQGDDGPANESEAEPAWTVLRIAPRAVDQKALVKLALATEFGRTALVLDQPEEDGPFKLAGIARRNPRTNGGDVLVLSTSAPGAVSLFYAGQRIVRYERGLLVPPAAAVLSTEGLLRQAIRASMPKLQASMQGVLFGARELGEQVFEQLLQGMRATGHGGSVLVLTSLPLEEPSLIPKYPLTQPDVLTSRTRAFLDAQAAWIQALWNEKDRDLKQEWRQRKLEARAELDAAISDVARLTAPDGALLMGPELQVLGAGYMVAGTGAGTVLPIHEASDAEGAQVDTAPYALEQHGARHRAAATFVSRFGGIAFVASEDGPLKVLLRQGERILLWRLELPEF